MNTLTLNKPQSPAVIERDRRIARAQADQIARGGNPPGMRIVPSRIPTARAPVPKAEWDKLSHAIQNRTPYYEPVPSAKPSAKTISVKSPKWYESMPDLPPITGAPLGHLDWRTYFCRAFVVNLDRRPDRLKQFYEGIPGDWPFCPVKRYVAVDGQNVAVPKDWKSGAGAYGLYCTYRDIIQRAIGEGWDKPVLLFEDDCLFVPGFAQRAIERMERLPADWDALWLGGQLYGKVMPHDHGVVRALKPHRTHSFAIAPQFFETVLKIWKEHWGHVDHAITRCASKFRIMAFDPPLTAQSGGRSNIAGRKKNMECWDHRTRTMFRRGA